MTVHAATHNLKRAFELLSAEGDRTDLGEHAMKLLSRKMITAATAAAILGGLSIATTT
ncbi:hypothetical protein [Streptomyces sp. NPDC004270]